MIAPIQKLQRRKSTGEMDVERNSGEYNTLRRYVGRNTSESPMMNSRAPSL